MSGGGWVTPDVVKFQKWCKSIIRSMKKVKRPLWIYYHNALMALCCVGVIDSPSKKKGKYDLLGFPRIKATEHAVRVTVASSNGEYVLRLETKMGKAETIPIPQLDIECILVQLGVDSTLACHGGPL